MLLEFVTFWGTYNYRGYINSDFFVHFVVVSLFEIIDNLSIVFSFVVLGVSGNMRMSHIFVA